MPWHKWSKMQRDTDLPEWLHDDPILGDFASAARRFYRIVQCRILWLRDRLKVLPDSDLAEAHYVLAELHDRLDLDDCRHTLRRGVRYHAIKTLRLNRSHASACALLGFAFNWTGLMSQTLERCPGRCLPDEKREVIFFGKATGLMYMRRGVRYLERAVLLDPDNEAYARWLYTARRELDGKESGRPDWRERFL